MTWAESLRLEALEEGELRGQIVVLRKYLAMEALSREALKRMTVEELEREVEQLNARAAGRFS